MAVSSIITRKYDRNGSDEKTLFAIKLAGGNAICRCIFFLYLFCTDGRA